MANEPSQTAYWLAYLNQTDDWGMWVAAFDLALEDFDYNLCQQLLQGARRAAVDEPIAQAWVRFKEGELAVSEGDWLRAKRCLEHAQQFIPADEFHTHSQILGYLGMFARLHGELDKAQQIHQQQMALAKQHDSQWVEADASHQLALTLHEFGRFDEALVHLQHAQAIWLMLDEPYHIAQTHKALGMVQIQQGKLDEAHKNLLEALDLLSDTRYVVAGAQTAANLGNLYILRKEYAMAEHCYQQALEAYQSVDFIYDTVTMLNALGGLAILRNQWKQALEWLGESILRARELNSLTGIRDGLLNLAIVLPQLGRSAEVHALYKEALGLSKAQNNPDMIRHIRRQWARFYIYSLILTPTERLIDWLKTS